MSDTDRLKTAFEDVVRGTKTQLDGEFDPRGWYPAEVVSWNNGRVDVRFDDRRLRSKAGVPLAPGVGVSRYQIAQGTRVLVAWAGGDIRYPFVAAAWLQRGGLVDFTQEFSGTYRINGPKVELCGGGRGVARLNDLVNANVAFANWLTGLAAAAGYVIPLPSNIIAAISSASSRVEADS